MKTQPGTPNTVPRCRAGIGPTPRATVKKEFGEEIIIFLLVIEKPKTHYNLKK